jgi:hypothetical protein
MLMPLLTKANKLVSHNKKINLDYNFIHQSMRNYIEGYFK